MAKDRSRSPSPGVTLDGRSVRLAIVVSEYHGEVTEAMLKASLETASRHRAPVTHTLRVPGVYDIPIAVRALLDREDVDAVVTLGAVVRGETDHDQVIVHAVARALLDLEMSRGKPVALGITGPGETLEQARARIDRGVHAVEAALKMVLRLRAL